MAELKTKPTTASVSKFLNRIEDAQKRKDLKRIAKIMKAASGSKPVMWGDAIVGYGNVHYKYASGREGDWFLTGFSPRKRNITLYIMSGFSGAKALLEKLGKHSTGKACLYITRLEDVDIDVLTELVERSVEEMRARELDLPS